MVRPLAMPEPRVDGRGDRVFVELGVVTCVFWISVHLSIQRRW